MSRIDRTICDHSTYIADLYAMIAEIYISKILKSKILIAVIGDNVTSALLGGYQVL